jgi:hypothetical protein
MYLLALAMKFQSANVEMFRARCLSRQQNPISDRL